MQIKTLTLKLQRNYVMFHIACQVHEYVFG